MSGRLLTFTFNLTKAGEARSFTFYAPDKRSALVIATSWAADHGYIVEEARA
jgi:hypothetical protein